MPERVVQTLVWEIVGNDSKLVSALNKSESDLKGHVTKGNALFKGLGSSINISAHLDPAAKKAEKDAQSHVGRMNSIFSHVGEGVKSSLEGIFAGAMSVTGGGVLLSGLTKIEQTTEKLLDLGMEHQSAWVGAMKRMTAFTGSAVEADKVLSEIHELAVDRALEFKPLSEAAFKLTEIGYKGPEIVTMFKGITAQAIALGKGTEGVTRLIGMLQMIEDSGKAAGRGLMQLERQGYQIFGTLEKVTGLDRQFLNKALSQGRLDPRAAIGMLTEGWEQQFGELAGKLSHGFKDEQTRLAEMMSEPLATVVSPLISSAKKTVVTIQEVFKAFGPGAAEALGAGLGYAADKVNAGLDLIIKLVKVKTPEIDNASEDAGRRVGSGFEKGLKQTLPHAIQGLQFLQSPLLQSPKGNLFTGSPNDQSQKQLEETYEKILKNPALQKLIETARRKYPNVPSEVISAVMAKESSGNPQATSPKGAAGLMQLMPGTARQHGVTNLYDPQQNVMGGTAELARLMKQFPGDISAALAHYNWSGRGQMPAETKDFVSRITGLLGTSGGGGISDLQGELNVLQQTIAQLNKDQTDRFEQINRIRSSLGYKGVGEESDIYSRTYPAGVYPKPIAPGSREEQAKGLASTNLTYLTSEYGNGIKELEALNEDIIALAKSIQSRQAVLDSQANSKLTWGIQRASGQDITPGSPMFAPPIEFSPPRLRRGVSPGEVTPERAPSELEMAMRGTGKEPGIFRRQAIESVKPLEGFKDKPIDAGIIVFHAALSKLERSTIGLNEAQEKAIDKALQKEPLTEEDLTSIKQAIALNREFSAAQKEAITSALANNKLTEEQTRLLAQVVFKFEAVRTSIVRGLTQQNEESPQQIRTAEADVIIGLPQRIGQVASDFLTKWDFSWKGAQQILVGGLKSVIVEPVAHVLQQMIEKWIAQQLLNLLGEKIMGTAQVASQTANTTAVVVNTGASLANTAAVTALTTVMIAQSTTELLGQIFEGAANGAGASAAGGGMIIGPGSHTSDSIPTWLSNGEYVMQASAVDRIGKRTLDEWNEGRMRPVRLAQGGAVGYGGSSRSGDTHVNITLNAPIMGGSSHSVPRSQREYLEMLAPALNGALPAGMR